MSAPRIIVPGATTAITRRTTLRKAFLAPWHPDVGSVWLYALAYAQWRTGVAVHHAIRVITHHHLTVTPETDNLPEFCWQFHHDVSCALNTLLARERYDAPRELFDGRSPHYMRLCDAPAQSSHLVYEYNDATGTVHRPPGWAGLQPACSPLRHLRGSDLSGPLRHLRGSDLITFGTAARFAIYVGALSLIPRGKRVIRLFRCATQSR